MLTEPDPELPGIVDAGPAREAPPEPVNRSWIGSVAWYVLLSALALLVLLPVWLTLMRALSTPAAAVKPGASPFVPHQVQWGVFRRAIATRATSVGALPQHGGHAPDHLRAGVHVAPGGLRLRLPPLSRSRRVVFAVFMATLLLPIEVTLLPNLHTVRDLDWFNSFQGMAVPVHGHRPRHVPDPPGLPRHPRRASATRRASRATGTGPTSGSSRCPSPAR